MELTAKDLKNLLKDIPDDAVIFFNPEHIMFWFNHNTRGINKWGGEWDNGIGYINGKCCGECSTFQCNVCNNWKEVK